MNLIPKWMRFIAIADNGYLSNVCKDIDCTYSHSNDIRSLLVDKGFITLEKNGRLVTMKLTAKGSILASKCADVIKLVSGDD